MLKTLGCDEGNQAALTAAACTHVNIPAAKTGLAMSKLSSGRNLQKQIKAVRFLSNPQRLRYQLRQTHCFHSTVLS
jgi:hypothetical protein